MFLFRLVTTASFVPRPHPACVSILKVIHAGVGLGLGPRLTCNLITFFLLFLCMGEIEPENLATRLVLILGVFVLRSSMEGDVHDYIIQ